MHPTLQMQSVVRSIEGFHLDELGDWVAELACGHQQHVRHKPPFWSRPWVLTEEGRAAKRGAELPCPLCDRFEMPKGYAPYKRTVEFTTRSMPAALMQRHATKPGVWGVIHVVEGRIRYIVDAPVEHEQLLEAGGTAVIVPEVPHHVLPEGDVRFFLEFHRRA